MPNEDINERLDEEGIAENNEPLSDAELEKYRKIVPFIVHNLRGPFITGLDPKDPKDKMVIDYMNEQKAEKAKGASR